jgi:ribonucrease Y
VTTTSAVQYVLAGVIGLAVFLLGYLLRKFAGEAKIGTAEVAARRILEEARAAALKEAESRKREALLEARDEAFRIKRDAERENREQRTEVQRLEKRLVQREETLDRKLEAVEKRDQVLAQREQEVARVKEDLEGLSTRHKQELERISGLTLEQARRRFATRPPRRPRRSKRKPGKWRSGGPARLWLWPSSGVRLTTPLR